MPEFGGMKEKAHYLYTLGFGHRLKGIGPLAPNTPDCRTRQADVHPAYRQGWEDACTLKTADPRRMVEMQTGLLPAYVSRWMLQPGTHEELDAECRQRIAAENT